MKKLMKTRLEGSLLPLLGRRLLLRDGLRLLLKISDLPLHLVKVGFHIWDLMEVGN